MIGVKEAVRIARDYIYDLYDAKELPNLLLEEVELSADKRHWLVTFGFDTNSPAVTEEQVSISGISKIRPKFIRAYKTIKIRADDGEPEKMKIRAV